MINDASAVVDESQQSSSGHVFISYQWDSKPTILMIRERLKQNGLNIWVDVDNMSLYQPTILLALYYHGLVAVSDVVWLRNVD